MTTQHVHASHPLRTGRDLDCEELTVPYAGQTQMRLTIASGMADGRIYIDPDATHLITIDCGDDITPRLRVSSSELYVSWRTTFAEWLLSALSAQDHDVDIVLHPAVAWTLQLRGGLSRVEADLAGGRITSFEVRGGISDARIELPAATGVVPIRISGGVSDLDLRRPAGSSIALEVGGGISRLRLDEQRFDAIGGGAKLAAGSVEGNASRYSVEVSGGVSGLQILHA